MAGTVYFHALMEKMPELMRTFARPLDRDEMKETTLYNYIAYHNFLVSSFFIHQPFFILPLRANPLCFVDISCNYEG